MADAVTLAPDVALVAQSDFARRAIRAAEVLVPAGVVLLMTACGGRWFGREISRLDLGVFLGLYTREQFVSRGVRWSRPCFLLSFALMALGSLGAVAGGLALAFGGME